MMKLPLTTALWRRRRITRLRISRADDIHDVGRRGAFVLQRRRLGLWWNVRFADQMADLVCHASRIGAGR